MKPGWFFSWAVVLLGMSVGCLTFWFFTGLEDVFTAGLGGLVLSGLFYGIYCNQVMGDY